MPEGRPERWIVDLTDRAAYLRGRYLTSYAQCEFLLAVKVDSRFRYALDKRINAAKAMADSNGPLNSYAADFVPLVEYMVNWSERRHWFAHGFMTFNHTKAGLHLFEFRRYEERDGKLEFCQWFATINDLEDAAAGINRYCQAFVALHEKIYLELKIEASRPFP
jgi:hypothetical protein